MSVSPAYANYWERKRLLNNGVPAFPIRRWWPADGLSDIEQVLFDVVRESHTLLDVGAGDLRVRKKLQQAGFRGEYHTQDIGNEFDYTFQSLDEIQTSYDSILFLDVLEHLPLDAGLQLLERLVSLVKPGGRLVVQTPNGRCVRDPMAWDMTHLQTYNIFDLWAWLTCHNLNVSGYRVQFVPSPPGPLRRLHMMAQAWFVSRWLGCDYADNLVLIAQRPQTTHSNAQRHNQKTY